MTPVYFQVYTLVPTQVGATDTSVDNSRQKCKVVLCRVCGFRRRVWESCRTKFRVRAWNYYRAHRSSGYFGTGVQNSQKFRAGNEEPYPYPGYCGKGMQNSQNFRVRVYDCPKELTEVPGPGTEVLQNFQAGM